MRKCDQNAQTFFITHQVKYSELVNPIVRRQCNERKWGKHSCENQFIDLALEN